MPPPPVKVDPIPFFQFEDIIDGYFPLRVSLSQMLGRMETSLAYVLIEHAPILEVPGLADDAPVPLNICAGRAGVIDTLYLKVEQTLRGTQISGFGQWRWLDDQKGRALDPMTRLAEPAYLRGFLRVPKVGTPTQQNYTLQARRVSANCGTQSEMETFHSALGFRPQFVWGPFHSSGKILNYSTSGNENATQLADFLLSVRRQD